MLEILRGEAELRPNNQPWDWRVGEAIYFWEQNPKRALEYAIEAANKHNKDLQESALMQYKTWPPPGVYKIRWSSSEPL